MSGWRRGMLPGSTRTLPWKESRPLSPASVAPRMPFADSCCSYVIFASGNAFAIACRVSNHDVVLSRSRED